MDDKTVCGFSCGLVINRVPGRVCGLLLLCATLVSLCGCSLFVMGGKMLFGDPKIPNDFRVHTGVDLIKKEKKVLVICSTPEAIKVDLPSLNLDLTDRVIRRLKRHEVDVVDPDDVATWMDDNGGAFDDPSELAQTFDADYIVHIDLSEFDFREPHSPTLMRGRARGQISGYQVIHDSKPKETLHVYSKEFASQYPSLHPVPADQISAKLFQQRHLDHVSTELARLFYDYKMGENF